MAFDIETIGAALACGAGSSGGSSNGYVDASKIMTSASGSPVNIFDASGNGIDGIDFFGESKQMQTTGKQFLDTTSFKTTTGDISSVSGNGYEITSKGGVNSAYSFSYKELKNVDLLKGKTIYFKADSIVGTVANANSCAQLKITLSDGSNQYYGLYFDILSRTIEIPNNATAIQFGLYSNNSGVKLTSENTVTAKGVRIVLSENDAWEKYTGGKASPNPDFPQPIESKIVNQVVVSGKNLLKFSQGSTTINGITFTVNADKSVTVNGTATADAVLLLTTSTRGEVDLKRLTGKNIILSGCPKGGSSSTYKFQFWSASKFAVDTGNGATLDLSTVPDSWNFAISIISGTTINNLTFKPMIRLASITDATYEPYQSQTVNLSAPIELNGFGGVRDTDKVKKFAKITANELSTFNLNYSVGAISLDNNIAILTDWTVPYQNMLCNIFSNVYSRTELLSNTSLLGIALATSDNGSCTIFFRITDIEQTEEAYNAYLSKTPLEVVFERAEPIETELPIVDQTAIKQLHTYKPNTVVMNDADAETTIYYEADAKAYIDNKFNELAKAIVNE